MGRTARRALLGVAGPLALTLGIARKALLILIGGAAVVALGLCALALTLLALVR